MQELASRRSRYWSALGNVTVAAAGVVGLLGCSSDAVRAPPPLSTGPVDTGTSSPAATDARGAPAVGNDASTPVRPPSFPVAGPCGATPTRLVDAQSWEYFIPPPPNGGGAVFTPDLAGVTATDVYYTVLVARSPGTDGCVEPACNLGYIARVPTVGGAPVVVAARIPSGIQLPIVVRPDEVIYATLEDQGQIIRVSFATGVPETLAAANGAIAYGVVADSQSLYWLDTGGVERAPLSGGAPTTLGREQPLSIALSGSTVVLDDNLGGSILSLPSAGGTATTLAAQQGNPALATACGASICWVNQGSSASGGPSAVVELSPGGQPRPLAAVGPAQALVFDGQDMFATTQGSVVRVPLDGGAAVDLAGLMSGVGRVVVDDRCAYWSNVDGIYGMQKSVAGSPIGP